MLGGCNGGISGEHLISAALFESLTVRVQGFSWCKDAPKEIGLSSLVSNILCEHHNNTLSNIDDAGGKAFSAIRDATRLYNVRAKCPGKRWAVREFEIDGKLLERWFLKTTINISLADRSDLRWINSSLSTSIQPPEELVQVAYGLSSMPDHWGLYGTSIIGQNVTADDSVNFGPLIRDSEFIVGALFAFRGHRFVLWLGDQPLPPTLASLTINDSDWRGAQVHYHLHTINYVLQARVSHRLVLRW